MDFVLYTRKYRLHIEYNICRLLFPGDYHKKKIRNGVQDNVINVIRLVGVLSKILQLKFTVIHLI